MPFYDCEMLVNLYVIIPLRLIQFINEDPINKIKIIYPPKLYHESVIIENNTFIAPVLSI